MAVSIYPFILKMSHRYEGRTFLADNANVIKFGNHLNQSNQLIVVEREGDQEPNKYSN